MTEQFTPSPRRGRPPAVKPEDAAEGTQPTGRRRRASVGVHAMKLSAPAREGYHRHWFNDSSNRIAQADDLAYDRVTDGSIKTERLVGTKANGEPLHAYLMETPIELYAEGLAEKEAHNRKVDEAIRNGRDSTGQHESDGYVGSGSIKS